MNDFEAMSIMSKENKDISMCPEIVEIKKSKQGGLLTIGLSPEVYQKLSNSMFFQDGKYVAALYVVNLQQFNEIKDK